MGAKKRAMGAKKKGASRGSEDSEELGHVPLQAILLADSFTTKFYPVTLERPKVLLPLVNVPMIGYTLAWLKSAGVKEVFVFCCAHSKQVINYLETSGWFCQPGRFAVTAIESHASASAGDALRLIYERDVIHGDFVLISGDTVSDMSLTQVLQEHKERRKKDNNAVMTIVIKPSQIMTHQSRLLGTGELFMAIDPSTKQLLCYEEKADHTKESIFCLDKSLLVGKSSISLHNDREDCYIDICSPEVLSLLADNFFYQDLRHDLLNGLLDDDVMGYKIFTHEIDSSYAAKIDNFRSYDAVSKDIIQRGSYPSMPDIRFTEIGHGTKIGDNTEILSSVIGEGCSIGSNVSIEGSYILDNVTIEDGCKLKHAVVCDGVVIKSGAVLEPGVVLSFQVVLGEQCTVPSYSKISLLQQPTEQDGDDEELEYADYYSNGIAEISLPINCNVNKPNELGTGGAGYVWSICDDDWRNSVAPIPADKLAEVIHATDGSSSLTPSGKVELESSDSEDSDEDTSDFENEVEETFLRAVHENIKLEHVVLEVNSLRLSSNKETAICAGAIFYSMMKLALEAPHDSASELVRAASRVISEWKHLLKNYLSDIDGEIEVIMKFEEMCLESAKEFSSVFDKILYQLYDQEVIQEEAILRWVEEKTDADESDRIFVRQAETFVQWLREAEEADEE